MTEMNDTALIDEAIDELIKEKAAMVVNHEEFRAEVEELDGSDAMDQTDQEVLVTDDIQLDMMSQDIHASGVGAVEEIIVEQKINSAASTNDLTFPNIDVITTTVTETNEVIDDDECEDESIAVIEETQDIRDQRVAESLYIYRKQRENELKKMNQKFNSLAPATAPVNHITFSYQPDRSPPSTEEALPFQNDSQRSMTDLVIHQPYSNDFYWTESMDIQLAKEVKACLFEFNDIAEKMNQHWRDGKFTDYKLSVWERNADIIFTKDKCRLRWADLDAELWSEVKPGKNMMRE
jgi:hypothetical protein